jgi:signal transduction histidine kinase
MSSPLSAWLSLESPRLVAIAQTHFHTETLAAQFSEALLEAAAQESSEALQKWVKRGLNGAQPQLAASLLGVQSALRQALQAGHSPEMALALQNTLEGLFLPAITAAIHLENQSQTHALKSEVAKLRESHQRLDKQKTDFVAVVAHELKTPLTLLDAYANMLKMNRSVQESEQLMTMVKGINGGTSRLRDLIEDMIDMTMLDMEVLEFDPHPLRVGQLLNLLREEMQKAAQDRKLSWEVDQSGADDFQVSADPERLFQALSKVVENAIKYTPDGGRIHLSVKGDAQFVTIAIKDSGIGLDERDQQVIFEKFFSLGQVGLHSTSKTKFKGGGAGLGLAIARGIILAHHGKIWVESAGHDEEALHGSCFYIQLPSLPATPA